jgi:hypothetical protein
MKATGSSATEVMYGAGSCLLHGGKEVADGVSKEGKGGGGVQMRAIGSNATGVTSGAGSGSGSIV